MIRELQNKDYSNFLYLCQTNDKFKDFYITKDKQRYFLNNYKIAKKVFNDCLKHGEKCFVKEINGELHALLLVCGFKDKFERKYIKVLAKNKEDFEDLFSYLDWQALKNLFIKVQKSNYYFVKFDTLTKKFKPSYVLRKNGFHIIAVRENEVLLKREDTNREYRKFNIKRD